MKWRRIIGWFGRKLPFKHESGDVQARGEEGLRWYHEEGDPKENEKTTPPEQERIRVHCTWAVELYLPSHLASLLRGVRALEWDGGGSSQASEDVEGWILDAMVNRPVRAAKYVNTVTKPGDERFFSARLFHAALPDDVDYARCTIQTLGGEVFAVVMQFVLTTQAAGSLERELRTPRQTTVEQIERGWSYRTPMNQKIEAIQAARRKLRDIGSSWFEENLPGFFTDHSPDFSLPAGQFITFDEAQPFERLESPAPTNYMWVLGLDHAFDAWSSEDSPGLRLGLGRDWAKSMLTLAGRTGDIFQDADELPKDRTHSWYATRLSFFEFEMLAWGLTHLASTVETRLSEIRNDLATLDLSELSEASRIMERGQSQFLELSGDLLASAWVIDRVSSVPFLFLQEVDTFMPLDSRRKEDNHLFEAIRLRLAERMPRLLEYESQLRAGILAQGSVVTGATQARVADRLKTYTLGLFLLTGALVVLTVFLVIQGFD